VNSSNNISELNLQQWLSLLETRHPSEIDLGLDRIRVVAQELDCLDFSCPIALVAGTNGKGSCVEVLKQLALSKGLKVGTYTSPHLLFFNERICINGISVNDESLVSAFVKVEQARLKSLYHHTVVSLTYFEFTTLAALCIFKDAHLDVLILEVGLGGRLDAVNIVDPDVSVISSIGIDHEAWLGKTRSSIAREKAGIARAFKPCIVGEQNLPDGLLETLSQKQAQVLLIQKDFHYEQKASALFLQLRNVENESIFYQINQLPRLAVQNVATALQAFLSMGFHLNQDEIKKAFQNVYLPGRCEVFPAIATSPIIICDLAHNPAGTVFFKQQVEQLLRQALLPNAFNHNNVVPDIKIALVTGVMADKNFTGMIDAFIDWDKAIACWFCCDLDLPRAAKAQDLARQIQTKFKARVFCEPSPAHALQNAVMADVDLILLFGSFYTLAPVYPALKAVTLKGTA
jgi:dihydrofolate synthase / folylpolyglutamate synthase